MGFTLAYLIVLLLGADPFDEKLRPYFEQQRRKPRHGTCKVLSVLSVALQVLSDSRWEQRARKRLIEILARLAQGRGVALLPAFSPYPAELASLLAIPHPLLRSVWEKLSAVLPSSECRVALADRNHSVCLVSENASTLRQFLCGREFIPRE